MLLFVITIGIKKKGNFSVKFGMIRTLHKNGFCFDEFFVKLIE